MSEPEEKLRPLVFVRVPPEAEETIQRLVGDYAPLTRLRGIREARALLHELEGQTLLRGRASGVSWKDMGEALRQPRGYTRPGLLKRHPDIDFNETSRSS